MKHYPIRCEGCGVPQAADGFQWRDAARTVRRGRCRGCRLDEARERRGGPKRAHDYELRLAWARGVGRPSVARKRKRYNDATRETASRHGELWTTSDLEMAADRTLTAAQVGRRIGRTAAAVQWKRERLDDER